MFYSFSDEASDDEDSDRCVIDKSVSQEERECKLLTNRMAKLTDKLQHTLRERTNLKQNLNRIQKALREEKKKYRELKKEVDKMANLMKEVGGEDEEEEDDGDEEVGIYQYFIFKFSAFLAQFQSS